MSGGSPGDGIWGLPRVRGLGGGQCPGSAAVSRGLVGVGNTFAMGSGGLLGDGAQGPPGDLGVQQGSAQGPLQVWGLGRIQHLGSTVGSGASLGVSVPGSITE